MTDTARNVMLSAHAKYLPAPLRQLSISPFVLLQTEHNLILR